MISVIYYCGLRAKEAFNLQWGHIDIEDGYIRIVNTDGNSTKSGKDRTIPIRKKLKPWLHQWYKKQSEPDEGYVFPSATGLNKWSVDCKFQSSSNFRK